MNLETTLPSTTATITRTGTSSAQITANESNHQSNQVQVQDQDRNQDQIKKLALIQHPTEIISPPLRTIRRSFELLSIHFFIEIFASAFNLQDFSIRKLEDDLGGLQPDSYVPILVTKLLISLTGDRSINITNWESRLRREFSRRDPNNNPLGQEPIKLKAKLPKKAVGYVYITESIPFYSNPSQSNQNFNPFNSFQTSSIDQKPSIDHQTLIENEIEPFDPESSYDQFQTQDFNSSFSTNLNQPFVNHEDSSLASDLVLKSSSSDHCPKKSEPFDFNMISDTANEPQALDQTKTPTISWSSLSPLTKIQSLHKLCDWHFSTSHDLERFRRLVDGKVINGNLISGFDERFDWRKESCGMDSKGNHYWLSGQGVECRLWVQRPEPQPPRKPITLRIPARGKRKKKRENVKPDRKRKLSQEEPRASGPVSEMTASHGRKSQTRSSYPKRPRLVGTRASTRLRLSQPEPPPATQPVRPPTVILIKKSKCMIKPSSPTKPSPSPQPSNGLSTRNSRHQREVWQRVPPGWLDEVVKPPQPPSSVLSSELSEMSDEEFEEFDRNSTEADENSLSSLEGDDLSSLDNSSKSSVKFEDGSQVQSLTITNEPLIEDLNLKGEPGNPNHEEDQNVEGNTPGGLKIEDQADLPNVQPTNHKFQISTDLGLHGPPPPINKDGSALSIHQSATTQIHHVSNPALSPQSTHHLNFNSNQSQLPISLNATSPLLPSITSIPSPPAIDNDSNSRDPPLALETKPLNLNNDVRVLHTNQNDPDALVEFNNSNHPDALVKFNNSNDHQPQAESSNFNYHDAQTKSLNSNALDPQVAFANLCNHDSQAQSNNLNGLSHQDESLHRNDGDAPVESMTFNTHAQTVEFKNGEDALAKLTNSKDHNCQDKALHSNDGDVAVESMTFNTHTQPVKFESPDDSQTKPVNLNIDSTQADISFPNFKDSLCPELKGHPLDPDWIEWEVVCSNLNEWQNFCTQFDGTEHKVEHELVAYLQNEVLPLVIESYKAEEARLQMEEAMAQRKRSFRLAMREVSQISTGFEEPLLEREVRMHSDRLEAKRLQELEIEQLKKEKEEDLRLLRRKEREEKMTLREAQLANERLAEIQRAERARLRAESKVLGQAVKVAKNGAENSVTPIVSSEHWELDCEICGMVGINMDDGSEVICCDKCEKWQHLACHDNADQLLRRPKRDWASSDFTCANCSGTPIPRIVKRLRTHMNGKPKPKPRPRTSKASEVVQSIEPGFLPKPRITILLSNPNPNGTSPSKALVNRQDCEKNQDKSLPDLEGPKVDSKPFSTSQPFPPSSLSTAPDLQMYYNDLDKLCSILRSNIHLHRSLPIEVMHRVRKHLVEQQQQRRQAINQSQSITNNTFTPKPLTSNATINSTYSSNNLHHLNPLLTSTTVQTSLPTNGLLNNGTTNLQPLIALNTTGSTIKLKNSHDANSHEDSEAMMIEKKDDASLKNNTGKINGHYHQCMDPALK
ncbi:hypothetical protein O181_029811 [Austropuccinia psidii MF-1]|uniref:PHD-type domain-containing protein n=1 Tax=Austropuccinia psidii MF-1 TaxID=1389203 RepID=A0A9Q3CRR1_9BASI|nr:hypothetical protein [Austropuccinia psidii MF-1]